MAELFLIDVHAHLQDVKFADDRDQVIKNAIAANVKAIINAGTCLQTSRQAIELARQYSCCKALVGIHPHDASKFNDNSIDELKQLASLPGVLGIGEIGLDFHYDFSPRDVQTTVFKSLWQLAAELNVPAIIHVREAYDAFFLAIKDLPAPAKVMLHCFSGDLEVARKAVDMGFHFSIGGALTFPKSDLSREVFKFIPESMVHLETDCPYLAPQPKRGKRNEPAYLPMTLEFMAKVKKQPVTDMAAILKQNAVSFFGNSLIE